LISRRYFGIRVVVAGELISSTLLLLTAAGLRRVRELSPNVFSKERRIVNHIRIAITVMLAVGCVSLAASGQTESTDSKKSPGSSNAAEPKVVAVPSPSFIATNYDKIAIVCEWSTLPKPAQADGWEQTINDEFTPALMQKGYEVPSSDPQPTSTSGPTGNSAASTKPDIAAIGKSLDVPAVMVINISNLKSEAYTAPVAAKPEASAAAGTETGKSTAGTLSNAMILTNTVPQNEMPKQATLVMKDLGSIFGKPNPPPGKAPTPAAAKPEPAKPAAPQYANSCSMSARLYSVGDKRLQWFGKVTESSVSATAQDYSDAIKAAADAIAGALPSRLEEAKK
jgi:hypothetical protein